MKNLAKLIARVLLGEYRLNRIYRFDLSNLSAAHPVESSQHTWRLTSLDENDMRESSDPRIRDHAWYGGDNAYGFGVWEHGTLVSATWFWNDRRFRDSGIWALGEDEAIMVDLVTAESHRGKGLAPLLTKFAAQELERRDFRTLYTWVWHSHRASIRSFEKAGWAYVAFVVEVKLLRLMPLRFVRRVA